jgi:hypothetical protein
MPEIPFIGGSYKGRSTNLNAQVSQNLYPVMSKDGKAVKALYAVPGMIDWTFKVGSEPFGPGKDLFSGAVSSIYSAYDASILRVDTVDSFPWNFNGNVSIKGSGFDQIPANINNIKFGLWTSWRSLVSKTNTEIVVHCDVVMPHSSRLRLTDSVGIDHDFPVVGYGVPGLYTVEDMVFTSMTPTRLSANMGMDGATTMVVTGRNFSSSINATYSALFASELDGDNFHLHPASLVITPTTISFPYHTGLSVGPTPLEKTWSFYMHWEHPTTASVFGNSNILTAPGAAAKLISISPTSGVQGNLLTLTGTDFPPEAGAEVWFDHGGLRAHGVNVLRISQTEYTCEVPVPPYAPPDTVTVCLNAPAGYSFLTSAFTYTA